MAIFNLNEFAQVSTILYNKYFHLSRFSLDFYLHM